MNASPALIAQLLQQRPGGPSFIPLSNIEDIQRQQALIAQLMQQRQPQRRTIGEKIGGAIEDVGMGWIQGQANRAAGDARAQNQAAFADRLHGAPAIPPIEGFAFGGGETPAIPGNVGTPGRPGLEGLTPEQVSRLALINEMAGSETALQALMTMQPEQPRPPQQWQEQHGEEIVTFEVGADGERIEVARGGKFKSTPDTVQNVHVPGQPQIGTIPPGFAARQREDGSWIMERIEGSPAEAEQQEAAAKEIGRQEATGRRSLTVIRDVNRALDLLAGGAGGPGLAASPVGQAVGGLIGTDTFELQKQIDSIGNSISLEVLQGLRDNSPTGGAVGQVPVQQQKMLAESWGSLDIRQRPEHLHENLIDMGTIMIDLVYGTPRELDAALRAGKISRAQHDAALREADQAKRDLWRERGAKSDQQGLAAHGVPPAAERVVGETYTIGSQRLIWRGTGWERVQ